MKHIITLSILFTALTSSAQLQKGNWNIGTSSNALMNLHLKSNSSGFKGYDFTLNPTIGYFIKNRWEIGAGPMFSFIENRYKDNFGSTIFSNKSKSYGINFYTRYYLKKEGSLIPYLTASAAYLRTNGNTTDFMGNYSSFKVNEWNVGSGAGLNWFITPKASLFSELNYTGSWGSGIGYQNGLNLKVGIQIYLGKKKQKK